MAQKKKRRGGRRRRVSVPAVWQNAGLAVLALFVLAGAAYALHRPGATTDATLVAVKPTPTVSAAAAVHEVVFFGDSYTGGSAMGGTDEKGWPRIVASHFGWHPDFSAEGGTGYIAQGPKHNPFPTRVADVIAFHPDLIVLQAGINDEREDPTAEQAAAYGVMSRLRAALPAAKIVVVLPFYPDQEPADLAAIGQAIRAAAVRAKITQFIDPATWFEGDRGRSGSSSTTLIGSDRTHPTDAGHAYIARLMESRLAALGY